MDTETGHDLEEFTRIANRLRVLIQTHTCCAEAAVDITKVVFASFVLDVNKHDPVAAADHIEELLVKLAAHVRAGALSVCDVKRDAPHGRAH